MTRILVSPTAIAAVASAGRSAPERPRADPRSRLPVAIGSPGSLGAVTVRLPMFPLGSVLFPGVTVPLHVFEDRYRALVHHLLRLPPAERVFGSVGIREGYEVGERGAQSIYRVGVRLQLSEVEAHEDGTFDLIAVALDRIRLDRLDTSSEEFPEGEVTLLPAGDGPVPAEVVDAASAACHAYRFAVQEFREDPLTGSLPQDPVMRSWMLAALAPVPMPEQQAMLEEDDAGLRLALAGAAFQAELRAMNVIPSLPATQVARTRWSPN